MQAKGLFLNYKKNRRLMQYFFKIRAGIIPSLTVIFGKGQILRSTPNTAPLICGACNTQPEGLSTMA